MAIGVWFTNWKMWGYRIGSVGISKVVFNSWKLKQNWILNRRAVPFIRDAGSLTQPHTGRSPRSPAPAPPSPSLLRRLPLPLFGSLRRSLPFHSVPLPSHHAIRVTSDQHSITRSQIVILYATAAPGRCGTKQIKPDGGFDYPPRDLAFWLSSA